MSYAKDHPDYVDATLDENDGWRWYKVESLGFSPALVARLHGIGIRFVNDLASWRRAVGSFAGIGAHGTDADAIQAAWDDFRDKLANYRRDHGPHARHVHS